MCESYEPLVDTFIVWSLGRQLARAFVLLIPSGSDALVMENETIGGAVEVETRALDDSVVRCATSNLCLQITVLFFDVLLTLL